MNIYLDWLAKGSGTAGILLGVGAMVARLLGHHRVTGFETMTLLLGGIALMAVSCVIQLNFLRKPVA